MSNDIRTVWAELPDGTKKAMFTESFQRDLGRGALVVQWFAHPEKLVTAQDSDEFFRAAAAALRDFADMLDKLERQELARRGN